jgi:hypothetical protein
MLGFTRRTLYIQTQLEDYRHLKQLLKYHPKERRPLKTILELKLSHHAPWRLSWERLYSSYSFLTSALDRGEWPASGPRYLLHRKMGDCRLAPDTEARENNHLSLPGIDPRSSCHPVCSQTLHQLSYRSSQCMLLFYPSKAKKLAPIYLSAFSN